MSNKQRLSKNSSADPPYSVACSVCEKEDEIVVTRYDLGNSVGISWCKSCMIKRAEEAMVSWLLHVDSRSLNDSRDQAGPSHSPSPLGVVFGRGFDLGGCSILELVIPLTSLETFFDLIEDVLAKRRELKVTPHASMLEEDRATLTMETVYWLLTRSVAIVTVQIRCTGLNEPFDVLPLHLSLATDEDDHRLEPRDLLRVTALPRESVQPGNDSEAIELASRIRHVPPRVVFRTRDGP